MIPDQFGALGILKAMQKNSIKFMPIIGWNFWFTENIFLARNAQGDIKKIQDGIDELVNSKKPFWMTLYVLDRNTIIFKFSTLHFANKRQNYVKNRGKIRNKVVTKLRRRWGEMPLRKCLT